MEALHPSAFVIRRISHGTRIRPQTLVDGDEECRLTHRLRGWSPRSGGGASHMYCQIPTGPVNRTHMEEEEVGHFHLMTLQEPPPIRCQHRSLCTHKALHFRSCWVRFPSQSRRQTLFLEEKSSLDWHFSLVISLRGPSKLVLQKDVCLDVNVLFMQQI